jgi:NAD(P)-dependent dehydrogenase (short-subunit alcohol dehydrogenase family)
MLTDKVAIVTGGGTGIGKAIGLALAKNGARVAILSRNRAHVEAAAEAFRCLALPVLPLQANVCVRQDVERAITDVVNQWGPIHILVNNAGISGLTRLDDASDSRWYDIIDTNLNGMFLMTKGVLRHMPDHGGGRIINISSVLGKFGVPGYTAYCTSKHGMIGFTRASALEVVARGITVNAICPGWVDTEMSVQGINESAELQGLTPEQFKAQAIAGVPIRRFLQPEEVAELVAYIASDDAKSVTGQAINICGGQTMA